MKKVSLIVFISLMATGLVIGVIGLAMYSFDFSRVRADILREGHYESAYITHTNTPTALNLNVRSQNVVIAQGDEFRVEYYQNMHYSRISYNIDNDVFTFTYSRRFVFTLFEATPRRFRTINVTVPTDFDGNINIYARSGNVNISNIDADKVNIDIRSGNTTITNMDASSINVQGRAGNITLNDVNVDTTITTYTRSGNTNINDATGTTVTSKSRSGNIRMIGLEFTNITTDIRSGNASVLGVRGNVEDYRITMSNRSGNSTLNGSRVSGTVSHGTNGTIIMTTRSGNNTLRFI
ncbi:MAG: DUF4097 domain-containing protein [Firmicutes bacterium]|nr:DUF4097 domain-containing protein [Bacillota bacterium]